MAVVNLTDCIEALREFSPFIPKTRLDWLRSHWDEAEPKLVEILADAARRPAVYFGTALTTYAMYLAAEMRSRRSHPCFLALCRLSEEDSEGLLGDILTQDMSRFLVSSWDGEPDPIKSLIEDDTIYEYARSAAVGALTDLVLQGRVDRAQVIFYFHSLLTGILEREPGYVWDAVACAAADLHPGDLMESLRDAYAAGYVDPEVVSLDELREQAGRGLELVLNESRRLGNRYPVGPVEQEIRWMQGFQPRKGQRKVGRNEPCPCGSGKKYKKCCLR